MANIPTIRNTANTGWIDVFCAGNWKIRDSTNVAWIDMTEANTRIRNAANSGWLAPVCPVYPARGILLNAYCAGTTKFGTYTDGVGGTYSGVIAINSVECGYVPPPVALMRYSTVTGAPGVSGRAAMKEALAELVPGGGTVLITDGPDVGLRSSWQWKGTSIGFDLKYHPRLSVVCPSNGWSGFGDNYVLMRENGSTNAQRADQASLGWNMVPAVNKIGNWGVPTSATGWFTIYVDQSGIGPGAPVL